MQKTWGPGVGGTPLWVHILYYTYFLIFMKKVMLQWLNDLRRYAEQSKARKFYDMGGEK